MQDKIKYVIYIILALFAIGIVLILGNKIKTLEEQRDDLQNQATVLQQKLDTSLQEAKNLQKKISELNVNLDKLSQEKTDIQKKLDKTVIEKEDYQRKYDKLVADKAKDESEKGKAEQEPRSGSDAYWASILRKKADLEIQLEDMKNKLKEMKFVAEQFKLDRDKLVFDLNNLSRENKEIQTGAAYNQKLADNLTQELTREKSNNLETESAVRSLKVDNDLLRRKLEKLGGQKVSLEKKLAELQSKNTSLENSLGNMETYVKQQVFQLDSYRSDLAEERAQMSGRPEYSGQAKYDSIQLPAIVVRPQSNLSDYDDIPGDISMTGNERVVGIDRDNNFAVINIGKEAGVKIGDHFQIYRYDQPIATIEVIQARDRISACDIKEENTSIKEGDEVR